MMKIMFGKTLLLFCALILSVELLAASAKGAECTASPAMIKLLNDMVSNATLRNLIKTDPKAIKLYESVREESSDAKFNVILSDPEALKTLISIPNWSKYNDNFGTWWDNLSVDEFEVLWGNEKIKAALENKFRQPGGFHEWCMVCEAVALKKARIKFSEIQLWRSEISQLSWTIPEHYADAGASGGHGGKGSDRFHQELRQIVQGIGTPEGAPISQRVAKFKEQVELLAEDWDIDPWPVLFDDW